MKKDRGNGYAANAVLVLKEKNYLTPHYIRATFHCDEAALFRESTVGVNNKIFIPPAGVKDIHFPEFDFEAGKWLLPPPEVCPAIRTYTHRGIDLVRKELVIDFVAHGDNGPASAWVMYAQPGDRIGVSMWTTATELYAPADWYLLAGDATAIPVLSVILETLPATARGRLVLEVASPEEEQPLYTRSQVHIQWIYNAHPEKGSHLPSVVRLLPIPEDVSRYAYVAAEFTAVKEIRQYLRKERQWTHEELNAYAYWKAGVSEEGSQMARRTEAQL